MSDYIQIDENAHVKNCPFCNSDDIQMGVVTTDENIVVVWFATCLTCVANGPAKINEVDAIREWNVRCGNE